MKLPKAKTDNIVVQNLNDETLIYNLTTNQAFCLNDTSTKVFESCDGKMSFAELKAKYQLTDEIIYLALDGLKQANLIETDYISPFAGLSRREVIKKVGVGTVIALPIISMLIAPTALSAASLTCNCSAAAGSNARPQGCPCLSNGDCCGLCLTSSSTCSAVTSGSAATAAACCPS